MFTKKEVLVEDPHNFENDDYKTLQRGRGDESLLCIWLWLFSLTLVGGGGGQWSVTRNLTDIH